MIHRTAVRWVLGRLLTQPETWVALAILGVVPPIAARVSPWSSSGPSAPALDVAWSWTYIAGAFGLLLALRVLHGGEAFLQRLAPFARARAEVTGLLVGAITLQIPLWGAACWDDGGVPLHLIPALVLTDLHLAALGSLALGLSGSASVRILLVFAGALILPSVSTGSGLWVLVEPLNPAGQLRSLSPFDPTGGLALRGLLPISALFLARLAAAPHAGRATTAAGPPNRPLSPEDHP